LVPTAFSMIVCRSVSCTRRGEDISKVNVAVHAGEQPTTGQHVHLSADVQRALKKKGWWYPSRTMAACQGHGLDQDQTHLLLMAWLLRGMLQPGAGLSGHL
jgi:hypothetical protein